MKLVAVCVTDHEVSPVWPDFVQLVDSRKVAPRGTIERVRKVAEMRNSIVEKALFQYPDLTHLLMIDSYYCDQKDQVRRLIEEYDDPAIILGAATLVTLDTHFGEPEVHFYDHGTTPEGSTFLSGEHEGIFRIKVRAVGAIYIFPIDAWFKNRYRCNPLYFEPEHIPLCEGFDCYLTFKTKFWRKPVRYSFVKKVRVLLGYYLRRFHVRSV